MKEERAISSALHIYIVYEQYICIHKVNIFSVKKKMKLEHLESHQRAIKVEASAEHKISNVILL